jgi:hypothetical protein
MSDRRSKPRSRISSNPKRTGEHSEIAFLYRADQRQFAISKPFGDSERYDFILDNRPRPVVTLNRIQVFRPWVAICSKVPHIVNALATKNPATQLLVVISGTPALLLI